MSDPDDTYPMQANPVRSFLREMSAAELRYHTDQIWPFIDSKISDIVCAKIEEKKRQIAEELSMIALSQMFKIDASTHDGKNKILNIMRFVSTMWHLQQFFYRVCWRCVLPWMLAILASVCGFMLRDYLPYVSFFTKFVN